ncbi:MAG TPA: hypothetical protein VGJ84_08170, partial [Polyangiaceae bacterium]
TFMLEDALREKLVTLADVADAVSFQTIAEHLPAESLRRALCHALEGGRSGSPFSEARLLEVVPLGFLVARLPLQGVWNSVMVARIAVPCGFVSASQDLGEPTDLQPVPRSTPSVAFAGDRGTPREQTARRGAVAWLSAIERLPPNHARLSTQMLHSIESMYGELLSFSDDSSRKAWIGESFPDEGLLREALLALLELLNPAIEVGDPVIRDAEIDSLIKLFLLEERRRSRAVPRSSRVISGTRPRFSPADSVSASGDSAEPPRASLGKGSGSGRA